MKISWDFTFHTGHHLENNKPDIVLHDKKRGCHIIDVACPFNTKLDMNEVEKIESFKDLKKEVIRSWKY